MELQIQSNIPIIILCIIVISLSVLGFLEYKKLLIKLETYEKKYCRFDRKPF